jgi:hypothetical protein
VIDFDNVLLRPARSSAAFSQPDEERPPLGAVNIDRGIVSAAIVYLRSPDAGEEAVDVFESVIAPSIAAAGGSVLGYFVSENSQNGFPRLPVRENEPVLVWSRVSPVCDWCSASHRTFPSRCGGFPFPRCRRGQAGQSEK